MRSYIEAFSLPKNGCTESDCEDAHSSQKTAQRVDLSIADGATESCFAREWAEMLVKGFLATRQPFLTGSPGPIEATIARLGEEWRRASAAAYASQPAPWYISQKAAEGAFAALLGLSIFDFNGVSRARYAPGSADLSAGKWYAAAIGDACLFHLRDGNLLKSFPIRASEEFDNRPFLLSSLPSRNIDVMHRLKRQSGEWRAGDVFLLMTDALACWFLKCLEQHGQVPDAALGVRSHSEFANLVNYARQERGKNGNTMLRNDDVTLIRCSLE